jgi:hypothetical protein
VQLAGDEYDCLCFEMLLLLLPGMLLLLLERD